MTNRIELFLDILAWLFGIISLLWTAGTALAWYLWTAEDTKEPRTFRWRTPLLVLAVCAAWLLSRLGR